MTPQQQAVIQDRKTYAHIFDGDLFFVRGRPGQFELCVLLQDADAEIRVAASYEWIDQAYRSMIEMFSTEHNL